MNTWLIALSAIKQRTRQFSFWAMMAFFLGVVFLFAPSNEIEGVHVLSIEPEIFVPGGNPTWISITAALVLSVFLPFTGFAYVRGMIGLDRHTGLMDVFLASGIGRFRYVFGKLLAGFILLILLVVAVMCGSLITILINFHGQFMNIWAFVSPFLALIPGLLFVTALSLILETSTFFRKDNSTALAMFLFVVIYFTILTYSINSIGENLLSSVSFDFSGLVLLESTIGMAVFDTIGKSANEMVMTIFGGKNVSYTGVKQLYFTGIPKSEIVFLNMIFIIGIALLLTFVAAILLENKPIAFKGNKQPHLSHQVVEINKAMTPLQSVPDGNFNIINMIKKEIKRILRPLKMWWYIIELSLWVASWVVSTEVSRNILLPIILGLAVLPLSQLGYEEELTGMGEWFRVIPNAPLHQTIASASGSVLLCLIITSPIIISSFSIGENVAMVILSLSVFLPSLSLFLGIYTKTERSFQLLSFLFLYMVLNLPNIWLPIVESDATIMTILYLSITIVLIVGILGYKKKKML